MEGFYRKYNTKRKEKKVILKFQFILVGKSLE